MSDIQDQKAGLLPNRQDSFYITADENDDLQPHQLSGDQSSEKSVISSDIANGGNSNFMLTVTTIMKTVIGAGIISLPSTINKLGYIFGLLVYIVALLINHFTAIMLLKSKNLARHSNYSSIMCHLFDSKAAKAFSSFVILLNNLGICIAELTIFKQAMHKIFLQLWDDASDKFYFSEWFIILCLAATQLPFTMVQKIEKLRFMAFVGVGGIVFFIACLMVTFFDEMAERDWKPDHQMHAFPRDWLQVASVIPHIMLALAFQMNFFPIFKGLKNANDSKMKKACLVGLCTVAFFYILTGNIGNLMYGDDVETNFLLNLTIDGLNDVLFFGMNGGFLLSIFFSFPVMFFGARNNFIALIQIYMTRNKGQRVEKENFKDSIHQISSYIQNGSRQEKRRKAKFYFYIYTLILFFIAIGIAISVKNIKSVFNLVGAIASNAIGYIFPCMFYYLLVKYKNKKVTYNYYIARTLFYFFIPFGVFSVVANYI